MEHDQRSGDLDKNSQRSDGESDEVKTSCRGFKCTIQCGVHNGQQPRKIMILCIRIDR